MKMKNETIIIIALLIILNGILLAGVLKEPPQKLNQHKIICGGNLNNPFIEKKSGETNFNEFECEAQCARLCVTYGWRYWNSSEIQPATCDNKVSCDCNCI